MLLQMHLHSILLFMECMLWSSGQSLQCTQSAWIDHCYRTELGSVCPVPAGKLLRSQSPVEATVHSAGKESLGLAAFDNVTQKPGIFSSSGSAKLNFEK